MVLQSVLRKFLSAGPYSVPYSTDFSNYVLWIPGIKFEVPQREKWSGKVCEGDLGMIP